MHLRHVFRAGMAALGIALVTGCTTSSEDQVLEVDGKIYRVTRVVYKQSTVTEESYILKNGPFRRECSSPAGCAAMIRIMRPEIRDRFLAGAPVVQPTAASDTPPSDPLEGITPRPEPETRGPLIETTGGD